jgi:hypothetical protein
MFCCFYVANPVSRPAFCYQTVPTTSRISGVCLRRRYWIDKASAEKVDQRVQKGLFLFACTNSCMNPIVYGYFNFRSGRGSGYTAAAGVRAAHQVRSIHSMTTTKHRHDTPAGSHSHMCRGSTSTCDVRSLVVLNDVSEVNTVHPSDNGGSKHL